jgi:hypothetical protein
LTKFHKNFVLFILMTKCWWLTLLLVCVQQVFSESIYILYPGPGVNWNPGANVAVRWNVNRNSNNGSPVDTINLDLMDGDANNAVLVKNIAVNVQAQYGVFHWVVPVDFEKRTDYFIRATGVGPKGISYFYSGRFAVNGPVWAATVPVQPWQHVEAERLRRLEISRKEEAIRQETARIEEEQQHTPLEELQHVKQTPMLTTSFTASILPTNDLLTTDTTAFPSTVATSLTLSNVSSTLTGSSTMITTATTTTANMTTSEKASAAVIGWAFGAAALAILAI